MFCSGRPPSMICSELSSTFAGIGGCGSAATNARRPGSSRTGSAALVVLVVLVVFAALVVLVVVGRDEPVGIELPRRKHRVKQRLRAEIDLGEAGEFQRAVVGAIARLELLEPGAGGVGLDFGEDPPRRRNRRLAWV